MNSHRDCLRGWTERGATGVWHRGLLPRSRRGRRVRCPAVVPPPPCRPSPQHPPSIHTTPHPSFHPTRECGSFLSFPSILSCSLPTFWVCSRRGRARSAAMFHLAWARRPKAHASLPPQPQTTNSGACTDPLTLLCSLSVPPTTSTNVSPRLSCFIRAVVPVFPSHEPRPPTTARPRLSPPGSMRARPSWRLVASFRVDAQCAGWLSSSSAGVVRAREGWGLRARRGRGGWNATLAPRPSPIPFRTTQDTPQHPWLPDKLPSPSATHIDSVRATFERTCRVESAMDATLTLFSSLRSPRLAPPTLMSADAQHDHRYPRRLRLPRQAR